MSRRRRRAVILLCFVTALLVVLLDNAVSRRRPFLRTDSGERIRAHDRANYHGKSFVVTNALDGDTIDVEAPDGKATHTRIRLLGIDTPETRTESSESMYYAAEAAAFTKQAVLGKSVTVYLDGTGPTRGRYGRLLAYVKLPDGRFLNEALLCAGCAYADLRFSHSFYNKYRQLESGARSSKKGLWKSVTGDQLPQWLQRENTDLLNK